MGKTAFLLQFLHNEFVDDDDPTIGNYLIFYYIIILSYRTLYYPSIIPSTQTDIPDVLVFLCIIFSDHLIYYY